MKIIINTNNSIICSADTAVIEGASIKIEKNELYDEYNPIHSTLDVDENGYVTLISVIESIENLNIIDVSLSNDYIEAIDTNGLLYDGNNFYLSNDYLEFQTKKEAIIYKKNLIERIKSANQSDKLILMTKLNSL